jgi:VanZ family protein
MRKNTIITLILILLLLAWMYLIYFLSDQSGLLALPFLQKLKLLPEINDSKLAGDMEYVVRKSAHMAEYAVLFILTYLTTSRLFFRKGEKKLAKALVLSLLICIAYAFSDESHQFIVPGRDGRIVDIFIDTFGILLGQLLVLFGVLICECQ